MDEDPDDPDHPLRDRDLRGAARRRVSQPAQAEPPGSADDFGMGEEVRGYRDRGASEGSVRHGHRANVQDKAAGRDRSQGSSHQAGGAAPGVRGGAPFVGVWGFGAMICIGVTDLSGADGTMPRVTTARDTAEEEEEDSGLGPESSRWVWNRAWVAADPRKTGPSEPTDGPATSKTSNVDVKKQGRWVWRGLVAAGSSTDKHATLRVKLAIDADGSSVDETRGVSVRVMGVTAPAAALSLGPCAGRTEHVAVFGRNGAVDVVSVPANSEPAVSKMSRHAPDATALLCNLDYFDRVPPRGHHRNRVRDQRCDEPFLHPRHGRCIDACRARRGHIRRPGIAAGFESVTSMWGLRFSCSRCSCSHSPSRPACSPSAETVRPSRRLRTARASTPGRPLWRVESLATTSSRRSRRAVCTCATRLTR